MARPAIPRSWLIRAAGSAAILAVLFVLLPREAVLAAFVRLPPGLFVLVLAGFAASHVVAAAKWWWLLGRGFPFGAALRAHFAGLAANLCLPGAAGGDAVRAGVAHLSLRDGAHVTAGAVADRLIDMLALACLSVAGILMMTGGEGASAGLAIRALVVTLVVAVAAVSALPRLVPQFWRIAPRLPGRAFAGRLAEALAGLGRRPMVLVATLALSMAVQGVLVLLTVTLARAIGLDLPLGAWFFAWPLAKIVAVLPVSLNGLGLREATLAVFLQPFGGDPAQVVAAGFLWQAVLFAAGMLGALVLGLTGLRPRSAATAALRAGTGGDTSERGLGS